MEKLVVEITEARFRARAVRLWVSAALGLMSFAQPAWSAISISPSPSYNGSYTVTWGSPLGCSTFYDDWGMPWDICFELFETLNGPSGPITGTWSSGSSLNVSGKASGIYTYTVVMTTYSPYWGSSSSHAEGPTSVQVILPLPDPNSYYQQTSGPVNNPQSYRLVWNATNATSCSILISWWRAGYGSPSHTDGGAVATNGQYTAIYKYWSDLDYVRAKTTCSGPGGSDFEEWTIDFNQNATP